MSKPRQEESVIAATTPSTGTLDESLAEANHACGGGGRVLRLISSIKGEAVAVIFRSIINAMLSYVELFRMPLSIDID